MGKHTIFQYIHDIITKIRSKIPCMRWAIGAQVKPHLKLDDLQIYILIPTAAFRAKELKCRILHWWSSRVTDTVASECHLRNASKHFTCKSLVLQAFLETSHRAFRQKTANISVQMHPKGIQMYTVIISYWLIGGRLTRCRCGYKQSMTQAYISKGSVGWQQTFNPLPQVPCLSTQQALPRSATL